MAPNAPSISAIGGGPWGLGGSPTRSSVGWLISQNAPSRLAAIQHTTLSWRQGLGERRFSSLERALTELNDLLSP